VPDGGAPGEAETELIEKLQTATDEVARSFESMNYRRATTQIRAVWALGNAYLNERAPWKAIKDDPSGAAVTLRTAANLIRLFTTIAVPVIPGTAERVLAMLGEGRVPPWPRDVAAELEAIPAGAAISAPDDVVFRKVSDEEVAEWKARFGAEEAARAA
jgi:methionyl-tRNA synthetase